MAPSRRNLAISAPGRPASSSKSLRLTSEKRSRPSGRGGNLGRPKPRSFRSAKRSPGSTPTTSVPSRIARDARTPRSRRRRPPPLPPARGRAPGEPGELAARGVMREAGHVIEMSVRDADVGQADGVFGRAAELEQRAEGRQLVEGFVARDGNALDRDPGRLDRDAAPAAGKVGMVSRRAGGYFRRESSARTRASKSSARTRASRSSARTRA